MRVPTLLLLAGLAAAAAGAGEAERVPGVVTLSDGAVHEGDVRTTAGKPLTLIESETGRRLDLTLPDIWRIRIRVVEEEQYRIWRWVEDGSREKVYTGESYPRRDYEAEVVLRTGQTHRGTLVAVLYIYPEGKPKPVKVILRKDERGEIGETLTDLRYVESVEFPGAKPPDDGEWEATIALDVEPAGSLLTAHALPRGREGAVEAARGLRSGQLRFPALLPDVYDLAVVTPDGIWLGLGVGPDGGETLTGEALAEVQARVMEIPDFFESREVLAAVRDGDRIRALVRKQRSGPTSLEGNHVFRRWEVWSIHRGGDRWLVDGRAYLWREHAAELGPPRPATVTKDLSAVKVESGITKVTFAVPGEDGR